MNSTKRYENEKFLKKLNNIRSFFRMLTKGYLSRQDATSANISPRSHDAYTRITRMAIQDEYLMSHRKNKKVFLQYQSTMYLDCWNFLSRLLMLKNYPSQKLLFTLIVTDLLSHCTNGLRNTQISNILNQIPLSIDDRVFNYNELLEAGYNTDIIDNDIIDTQMVSRLLTDLAEIGYIQKQPGKAILYQNKENLLTQLNKNELKALYTALLFYGRVSHLPLPSYTLLEKIKIYLSDTELPQSQKFFTFKYNRLSTILDNDIVYPLLKAIKTKQAIKITYKGKSYEGIPENLYTDSLYNRQYLHMVLQDRTLSCRIDQLTKIEYIKKALPIYKHKPLKQKHFIELRLYKKKLNPNNQFLKVLNKQPKEILTDTMEYMDIKYKVNDPLRYIPHIRGLYPTVQLIQASTPIVKERLVDELKEALKNYGHSI